ncbi:MAG: TonB-dependent receptor [Bacteroidia bacterium]|nr:TonB-dependent receptor [Bacteroidia bacterium]
MKKLLKHFHHIVAIAVCFLMANTITAQEITQLYLDEVVATARRHIYTATADSLLIASSNQENISNTLRLMPSVIIKDYGGLGGIKSINIRSLGATHTGVSLDGIPMANMQTGTIDLSSFATPSITNISTTSAEAIGLLSTPKSRAQGANVSINTSIPNSDTLSIFANISTGTLNHRINTSTLFPIVRGNAHGRLSLGYEYSDGKYRYRLHYGNSNSDSVSTETRQNGEVWRVPAELDIAFKTGIFSHRTKINSLSTTRGLPRATTYYSLNSNESLSDYNLSLQHSSTASFDKYRVRLTARYTRQHETYRNPDALGSEIYRKSTYLQHNTYAAIASEYYATDNLTLALSTDVEQGRLYANTVNGTPNRLSTGISFATKWITRYLTLNGDVSLLNHKDNGHTKHNVSESLSLSLYLNSITVQLQGKNTSRLPSFNDLYYNGIGNRNLDTERATQISTTLSYHNELFTISGNYYHNIVKNKIVAMPTKNIFFWTMLNVGKVDIQGFDISLRLDKYFANHWGIMSYATYTRQYALDITSRSSSTYRHQIAYTPRLQGSLTATLQSPIVDITYSLVYQGKRYALNQNIHDNALNDFCDERVCILYAPRTFPSIAKYLSNIQFEINNLGDHNYQVVRNYPMPGRQYNILINIKI